MPGLQIGVKESMQHLGPHCGLALGLGQVGPVCDQTTGAVDYRQHSQAAVLLSLWSDLKYAQLVRPHRSLLTADVLE